MTIRTIFTAMVGLIASIIAGPALAHPHVTVVARSSFVVNDKAQIIAIRHAWRFDDAFSAYAVTGLKAGADGKVPRENLTDLAKVNIESLNEFGYFTELKNGGKILPFADPLPGFYLEHDGTALTLNFDLPLKVPVALKKSFGLKVSDETFFVAFSFAEKEPSGFIGDAKGCKIEQHRPKKQLDVGEVTKLGESFFSDLKSGFSDQFASTIRLECPAD